MYLHRSLALVGLAILGVSILLMAQESSDFKALPPDLLARLWRAQNSVNAAQLALERTPEAQALRDALAEKQKRDAEWSRFCGEDYQPATNEEKDPVCKLKTAK